MLTLHMVRFPYLFFLFLGLLTVLAHRAQAQNDPQLKILLDKHLTAIGGWKNWSQVESIRLSGSLERSDQTADFMIIKKRPDQIRATLTFPLPGDEKAKFQVIRAFDGKSAWTASRRAGSLSSLTPKILTGAEAESLRNDAGVLPKLLQLWRTNAALELMPPTTIEGQPVLRIQARPKDSEALYIFYLSAEDFRTRRYEHTENAVTTITDLLHYEENDGVWLPQRTLISDEKTGQSLLKIQTIQIGVGIYKEYFQVAATTE